MRFTFVIERVVVEVHVWVFEAKKKVLEGEKSAFKGLNTSKKKANPKMEDMRKVWCHAFCQAQWVLTGSSFRLLAHLCSALPVSRDSQPRVNRFPEEWQASCTARQLPRWSVSSAICLAMVFLLTLAYSEQGMEGRERGGRRHFIVWASSSRLLLPKQSFSGLLLLLNSDAYGLKTKVYGSHLRWELIVLAI